MARNKQMMSYRQEHETTTVTPRSAQPTFDEIQARAYAIYVARGDHPGTASDDWFQAERELKADRELVHE